MKRSENVCVFSWWSLIHSNAMTELKPEAISSTESPGRRPTLRHFQQDGHESQAAVDNTEDSSFWFVFSQFLVVSTHERLNMSH